MRVSAALSDQIFKKEGLNLNSENSYARASRYIRGMSGKAISKTESSSVLYKFRLTADGRSVAIDREEIASVVADRNDAANAKEVHFRRVTASNARKRSWNVIAVGCAQ